MKKALTKSLTRPLIVSLGVLASLQVQAKTMFRCDDLNLQVGLTVEEKVPAGSEFPKTKLVVVKNGTVIHKSMIEKTDEGYNDSRRAYVWAFADQVGEASILVTSSEISQSVRGEHQGTAEIYLALRNEEFNAVSANCTILIR